VVLGVAVVDDDDILSQGGDREPSPWPRRLAVIVALIVVVVGAVAAYRSLPRHQHASAAVQPTPAAASPVPVPAVPSAPPGPNGIPGPTLAWNSSLRLPDAGAQPVWFSPASGGADPIGGLPANKPGYQFTRLVGGWAIQASPARPSGCDGCAAPPAPVWYLADGARSVTRVGTADLVAPGARAGTVWLTSYPLGADVTTATGTASETGATGALTRPVRLPPGYAIDQGTERGLLLTPASPAAGAVSRLWDPSSGRTSQTFPPLLAASPSEIAWTSGCAPQCSVRTLDLATGRRTVVTLPPGKSVSGGTFSPDGRFLALQVSFGDTGDGGDLAMQLQVASVTSGRLTAVPGTWVSSDALVGFGWPASGDSLVAEFTFTTKMQLASWHPGASHPAVTVVQPGPHQAALILG
jgi:hypothetical protein